MTTTEAQQVKTPPFRILVVSDLAPPGQVGGRARLAVDKDSLDALVGKLCGTVRLRIGASEVALKLDSMAAFRPESVAAQAGGSSAAGAGSAIDQVLAATPSGNPTAQAVLTHPDFVRLERAWRSLKFLVDRVDFRQDIKVEVIAADKPSAPGALRELVRDPEFELPSDEPVSVVVADYELDESAADQAILAQLADLGMDLYAPVLSSVGEGFFGVKALAELAKRHNVRSIFDDAAHDEWRSFRKGESSRWVALCCNRFLLRAEQGGAPALYGNPAYALASVCARRFAELRWCSQITGPQTGVVPNLPVRMIEAGGREVNLPIEAVLPEQVASDLGDAGLVVLLARPNSDAAHLLRAPTTHEHERYNLAAESEQSRLRISLEHQLFVGRLAQQLESLSRAVVGVDATGIESLFEQAIAGMLKLGGRLAEDAALAVKVIPTQGRDDRYDVIVNLRPGKLLLAGRVTNILLTFRVAR